MRSRTSLDGLAGVASRGAGSLAIVLVVLTVGVAACGGGSATSSDPVTPTTTGAAGQTQEEGSTEASDESATLDILSDAPAQILLDGKPIGKAPLTNYKVPPGAHDITFVDEHRGNTTMSINVGPNESQVIKAPSQAAKFGTPQD